MTFIQSVFLGIVQGLTEFFPVSSSAHLKLAKWLLGVPDGEHLLYFDLVCHSGTLLALIWFLKKDILAVFSSFRTTLLYGVALVPLVPAYFLLKPIRVAASEPSLLGYFLLFTSFLLFAASRQSVPAHAGSAVPEKSDEPLKLKDVLCIGIMQAFALIPGISRSGSTISAARFLGWDWLLAARFSFLLGIPAILGGQALETLKLLKGSAGLPLPLSLYGAGFAASFACGLISVRFIFRIYERGAVRPFAWYCLAAGLFAIWAFHG